MNSRMGKLSWELSHLVSASQGPLSFKLSHHKAAGHPHQKLSTCWQGTTSWLVGQNIQPTHPGSGLFSTEKCLSNIYRHLYVRWLFVARNISEINILLLLAHFGSYRFQGKVTRLNHLVDIAQYIMTAAGDRRACSLCGAPEMKQAEVSFQHPL